MVARLNLHQNSLLLTKGEYVGLYNADVNVHHCMLLRWSRRNVYALSSRHEKNPGQKRRGSIYGSRVLNLWYYSYCTYLE